MRAIIIFCMIFSYQLFIPHCSEAGQCPNCNLLENKLKQIAGQIKALDNEINELVDQINDEKATLKMYENFLKAAENMLKNKEHVEYCPHPENKGYKNCDCDQELHGRIGICKNVIQQTNKAINNLQKQYMDYIKKREKLVKDLFETDSLLSKCRNKEMMLSSVVGCNDFDPCTEGDHCSGGACVGTRIQNPSPSSPECQ